MNNISKKLNEVHEARALELKSESVELGGIQDVKKLYDKAQKEFSTAIKSKEKVTKMATDSINAFKNARIASSGMLKTLSEVEKQAKSLGVDLPSGVTAQKAQAEKFLKEGGEMIQKLQSIR